MKLHEDMTAMLNDFGGQGGRVRLDHAAWPKWVDAVKQSPHRRQLGVQLIAVAGRFADADQIEAMDQTIILAVLALGREELKAALEAGVGAHAVRAKQLVTSGVSAATSPTASASGLCPHGGGVRVRTDKNRP